MEFEFKIPLQRGKFFFFYSLKPYDSTEYYYAHVKNGAMLEVDLPDAIKQFGLPGYIFVHDVKRISYSENVSLGKESCSK